MIARRVVVLLLLAACACHERAPVLVPAAPPRVVATPQLPKPAEAAPVKAPDIALISRDLPEISTGGALRLEGALAGWPWRSSLTSSHHDAMMSPMRTTLEIDDDVLQAARSVAAAEGKNIGKALSELARRGLAPQARSRTRSGFPVFDLPADAPPITLEHVRAALDEE